MDYILTKDSSCNWHLDGVKSGSVREQRLCSRLARRFFSADLIANTPNFLVECVVRSRSQDWSNLPTLMDHCNKLVFYDFDGRVYFFFDNLHN